MTAISTMTLLGRELTTHSRPKHKGKGVSNRYTVDGVYHLGLRPNTKGKHEPKLIRFKSIEAARNHIRTMGLAR